MQQWQEFNKLTGRTTQHIVGSAVTPPDETSALGRIDDIDVVNGSLYYINPATRVVTPRVASSITASQAGAVVTLAGVAVGTVLQIMGDAVTTVTQDSLDGQLQITFTSTGTYLLSAEQFPELPFQTSITV